MELSKVVPWGRSLNEYRQMFSLSADDLRKKILGCADGPASFNAELTSFGGNVVSVDPIYHFDARQIRARIDEAYPQIMEQVTKKMGDYVWKHIRSVEELGQVRMNAMLTFLADYEQGKASVRYIDASLPRLPFASAEFDLALCSHYLFLYSEQVDQEQHILSMQELCRVAREVRVYPLQSIGDNQVSPHLQPVISALSDEGIAVSLVPVAYEFQKGATEMLLARSVQGVATACR